MTLKKYITDSTKTNSRAIFKHVNNRDIAFEIYSYQITDEGHVSAEGHWLNVVNPKKPFIIDYESILIKKNQLKNWESFSSN